MNEDKDSGFPVKEKRYDNYSEDQAKRCQHPILFNSSKWLFRWRWRWPLRSITDADIPIEEE